MKTFLVPLTPEEETDCLCRLKNGEQGAKEELVLHNMRLVAHVAKKYVRMHMRFQFRSVTGFSALVMRCLVPQNRRSWFHAGKEKT